MGRNIMLNATYVSRPQINNSPYSKKSKTSRGGGDKFVPVASPGGVPYSQPQPQH